MRAVLLTILLAASACSPIADPIGGAWQRIADADGPITAPGVDRMWFTLAGRFTRELPDRTFSGAYDEDDNTDTLTLRSGAWTWAGSMSGPACPEPWTARGRCLLLHDERGVRDLYRPLAPLADGVWF